MQTIVRNCVMLSASTITLYLWMVVLLIETQQSNSEQEGVGHQLPITFFESERHKYARSLRNQDNHKLEDSVASFIGNITNGPKNAGTIGGVLIRNEAQLLGSSLRRFMDEEGGVYSFQKMFDGLQYGDVHPDDGSKLEEVCADVQRKLAGYVRQLRRAKLRVQQLYQQHQQQAHVSRSLPCCHLADALLEWDDGYQAWLSLESACDQLPLTHDAETFNPGRKLTQVFQSGAQLAGGVKWQYFLSAGGLLTQYPAHRAHKHAQADCDTTQTGARRAIYTSTVYKQRKNVVIMVDHGNALSHKQMATARAVARYILFSLGSDDRVSVISLSAQAQYAADDADSSACLTTRLVPLSYETRQRFTAFIDLIQKDTTPTNHSLGFEEAFRVISNTLLDSGEGALIVYISRGLLSSIVDARGILEAIAVGNGRLGHRVVINTYAIINSTKMVMYEKSLLTDIAMQNFYKHPVKVGHPAPIPKGRMVVVNNPHHLDSVIGDFLRPLNWSVASDATVSQPFIEGAIGVSSKGLLMAFTWPCFYDDQLLGIVGIDVRLAAMLEEVTYLSPDKTTYAFLIDAKGFALVHPSLKRPQSGHVRPAMRVSVSQLETHAGFADVLKQILRQASGSQVLKLSRSTGNSTSRLSGSQPPASRVKYLWKRLSVRQLDAAARFIVVIRRDEDDRGHRRLKALHTVGAGRLLYHRLDLLPTDHACAHFRQLATLRSSALFLSSKSFQRPFAHLSQRETKRMVQGYLAYLNDGTGLISNPGIKEDIRRDVLALSRVSEHWADEARHSENSAYIVRRYVASPSGVLLMMPGTLLNKSYDPTTQQWYSRASEFPGRVTMTAPYLDAGGAGYIVTISHTVYEGKSGAPHSVSDRVAAVTAVDISLGYFYKRLVDQLPVCSHTSIRCFVIDDGGYLIAHRALLRADGKGPLQPQHITHQESLIANEILYHTGFVQKKLCNSYDERITQRFYHFNTSMDRIITNIANGEPCAKYQVVVIPGTNMFLGIINETCSTMQAFCPCNIVDRLCLNCGRMEQAECECPCECPLPIDACTGQLPADQASIASCAVRGVQPPPVTVRASVTKALAQCPRRECSANTDRWACLGVVGCEWCRLERDGVTAVESPFCSSQLVCFMGVLDAPSPYLTPNHAHKVALDPLGGGRGEYGAGGGGGTPVGPVAGGIMAGFLVLALAVYCYRHQVSLRAGHRYESADGELAMRVDCQHAPLDDPDDLDSGHTNILLAPFELSATADVAAVSPYRVNTAYQRPPPSSDHGYSSMSPPSHDDSASTSCTEPTIRERHRPPAAQRVTTAIPPPPPAGQTTEPHPATLSPHQVLASVQVHMVDIH